MKQNIGRISKNELLNRLREILEPGTKVIVEGPIRGTLCREWIIED